MTDHIEWEQPPTSADRYGWFYDALRERPGEWARYPGSPTAAYKYCQRHAVFEVAVRGSRGDQKAWMRFVGQDGAS